MNIQNAIKRFKKEIGKKVIAYEDKGDRVIIITDFPNGKCDTNYYEVTESEINVTNPILSNLNNNRVVKL